MAGARFKREEPVEVVELPEQVGPTWSDQQLAIFDWFQRSMPNAPENLVVIARAGTGKTTTIVEGVNRAPEDFILVCAFNKKIADTLTQRCTKAEARTLHSLGMLFIRRAWPKIQVAKYGGTVRSKWLTDQAQVIRRGADGRETLQRGSMAPRQVHTIVTDLHTKARDMGTEPTFDAISALADEFNFVVDNGWGQFDQDFVVYAAISAIEHAAKHEPKADIGIDFADMIFLPRAWNLITADYQLVVVDEGQDMTVAQLDMAQRACSGRMCIVGDNRQAIYRFRGADSGSLGRLKRELDAVELGLNTTYRCAQSIVRRAQGLVPDIYAAETNPEGIVDVAGYTTLIDEVKAGDFVLSRINAPLVSLTLRLIRQGKRARMAGRDIGGAVKTIMEKLCGTNANTSVEDMLLKLEAWERKMVQRYANSGKLDLVDKTRDQADTIRALSEDTDETTVAGLIRTLAWLFEKEDEMDPSTTIICSSVHKAKGLEAERVFVLMESFYRRPGSEEDDEEKNIEYVAVTRAKSHLTQVYDVPSLTKKRVER
jgi:superfamily I DNA/RNA helicase